MKTLLISTSCLVLATGAFAQIAAVDTDGDGVASMTEIQAVVPDLTADVFAAIDANGDGVVDEAEMQAAQESGLLPPAG